jgi:hypothetical protein
MSRGPGSLGNRILDILRSTPTGRMPKRDLRSRFPLQVRDRSYHRALKSLERGGHVLVSRYHVTMTYPPHHAEMVEKTREALQMVATLARARGVPVPKLHEKVPVRWPGASR